jgi:hypothetical protein
VKGTGFSPYMMNPPQKRGFTGCGKTLCLRLRDVARLIDYFFELFCGLISVDFLSL